MSNINKYFIDLILIGLLLLLTLVRDLATVTALGEVVTWVGSIVAILYLVAYRWINKPLVRTSRSSFFTVLYGISLALMAITLTFLLAYLPGGYFLTTWACVLAIALVAIDGLISAFKKPISINKPTAIRLVVLACLTIVISQIPLEKRVLFTHRNNSDFIKFYEEKRSTQSFTQIMYEYEKTRGF